MRLRYPAFLFALFLATFTLAAPPQLPPGVKAERDLAYVPNGDPAQALDLYLPEKASDKPLPVIVWIHGGGWHAGSKSGCPAIGWVTQGYAAASVEYRFSDKAKFPAQIQDCQAAIRFLRANAKKYNLDADHIGVWGDSAGGHLVALLGTSGGKHAFPPIGGNDEQSDRVQAVCDWYGPANFNDVMQQASDDKNIKSSIKWNTKDDPYSSLIGADLGSDKARGEAVSPVHYVSKDNPPFLIMHGDHDPLVPLAQSEELEADLKAAGVPVLLQKFPGAGHGGQVFWNNKAVRGLIKAFFDKNLKGEDVKVQELPESEVTTAAAKK